MLLILIIIFFVAIISAFGMLMFRAWEIKTSRVENTSSTREIFPKIYFRHVEKIMLYLAKHIIQWVVLIVVKYWFILVAKTKKWGDKNIPKISEFFKKKTSDISKKRNSFIRKSVLESKMKIRNIREKVRRDHEK